MLKNKLNSIVRLMNNIKKCSGPMNNRWTRGTKLNFNWIWTLRYLHSIVHLTQKLKIR